MPDLRARPLASCSRIAALQHGVISAAQAAGSGLSAPSIRRLVRSGTWVRIRPGVYALWVPESRGELWLHRLTACALWLGKSSAVSHRAAATSWELDGPKTAPIELTTTGRRRSDEAGLVIHRVRSLRPDEIAIRDGMPVTTVPRTLIDLCAVVEAREVELALESALRKRLTTLDEIASALARSGRRWRIGNLAALLERHPNVPTESALETLVWRLLRDGGLPLPARQHLVRSASGRPVARVDFAYPDARLVIEADGHEFHSAKPDWQRDRSRQNALTKLGWRVYRVTWEDVTRRAREVVADVARLLRDPGSGADRAPKRTPNVRVGTRLPSTSRTGHESSSTVV